MHVSRALPLASGKPSTPLKHFAAIALAFGIAACANAASETDNLKAELVKKFPDRPISSVRTTPIKGIFEVVFAPKQVVYSDAKGNYLLVGDLVDINKKTSLTEARVRELSKTDFAKLPLDLAIKVVRGDGSRKVAVFSDPDCPYCRKLEQETIKQLDNVTVYNYVMPLPMHADAPRKSHLMWCSADPAKAWNDWMFDGKLPDAKAKADCEAPLAKIEALAQSIGVSATPSMVFANGEVVSGALGKEAFEKQLAAKKP